MDYEFARHMMVENQVRTNKVTAANVVRAVESVPREAFVPEHLKDVAYVDEDLPLGGGRYLMEPMVMARMIQVADIEATDAVLDVGCGPGYSAAVLGKLAGAVVAVESDESLAARATEALGAQGVDNAAVIVGDMTAGCKKQAPYDVIFIGGGVGDVPKTLFDQLNEGGRLIAPVLGEAGICRVTVYRKLDGEIGAAPMFDCAVPPLPGFEKSHGFVF